MIKVNEYVKDSFDAVPNPFANKVTGFATFEKFINEKYIISIVNGRKKYQINGKDIPLPQYSIVTIDKVNRVDEILVMGTAESLYEKVQQREDND